MNYEQLHKESLKIAQRLVREGRITEECAKMMMPDFVSESDDERIRKALVAAFEKKAETGFEWVEYGIPNNAVLAWLEKQKDQKPVEHLELKSGHWYICYRAYCCRADHLTVREGEKFMCEKDGVVKGFVIKDAEKYFREVGAPEPFNKEQKPAEWSEEDKGCLSDALWCVKTAKIFVKDENDIGNCWSAESWLRDLPNRFHLVNNQRNLTWHNVDAQYEYPLSITRYMDENGDFHYCISSGKLDDSCEYISVAELELSITGEVWKPSEEQMAYLQEAIDKFDFCDGEHNGLIQLYNDLKKL